MTPSRTRIYANRRTRRRVFIVGIRGRGARQRIRYEYEAPLRRRPTLYTQPFTSPRETTPERFAARFEEVRNG